MDSPSLRFVGFLHTEVQFPLYYLTSQSISLSFTVQRSARTTRSSASPVAVSVWLCTNLSKSLCWLPSVTAVAGLPACSFCRNSQNPKTSFTAHSLLYITALHGWLMVLLWTSDGNTSHHYIQRIMLEGSREKYRGDVLCGSFFGCCVLPPLQIISRRSAQRVTDIPTHAPMCRFCTWEKMMCRAQECLGRSRAMFTLRFHPPAPHFRCLLDPATHRHPKYPSTQNIRRHHKHPNTLWRHISLSIRLSQPEKGLNRKVRIKCFVH